VSVIPAASDSAPVPDAYLGVWRRTLLRVPGQPDDTTSDVLWMQTRVWHADVRVRADRPAFAPDASIETLDRDALLALADHKGFSGVTAVEGDVCRWLREVDFQPPSGFPDIGRMEFDTPDRAFEYGIEQDYFEIWERLPESVGPTLAFERVDGPRPMRLLRTGDCVMRVRPRDAAIELPEHPDGLRALAADVDAATLRRWLDFELSFARLDASTGGCTITRSTWPWLEGRDLPEAEVLLAAGQGAASLVARHWREIR
jgi:hypothetical protein